MKQKIIGIAGTHAFGLADRFKDYSQTYVNQDYIDAIVAGGGLPIILPINTLDKNSKATIALVDGLVLTGGKDLEPKLYGEANNSKLGTTCRVRDTSDRLYLEAAMQAKKPILGVCRGMHLLNVLLGGSLYQDLSYFTRDHAVNHDQKFEPTKQTHAVMLQDGSILKTIFQTKKLMVNSFHHQIIKQVAPGFKVTAFSEDHAPEAIEATNKATNEALMFGVQWHPEMLAAHGDEASIKFFKYFIDRV